MHGGSFAIVGLEDATPAILGVEVANPTERGVEVAAMVPLPRRSAMVNLPRIYQALRDETVCRTFVRDCIAIATATPTAIVSAVAIAIITASAVVLAIASAAAAFAVVVATGRKAIPNELLLQGSSFNCAAGQLSYKKKTFTGRVQYQTKPGCTGALLTLLQGSFVREQHTDTQTFSAEQGYSHNVVCGTG